LRRCGRADRPSTGGTLRYWFSFCPHVNACTHPRPQQPLGGDRPNARSRHCHTTSTPKR
jgi:hypothetical protein